MSQIGQQAARGYPQFWHRKHQSEQQKDHEAQEHHSEEQREKAWYSQGIQSRESSQKQMKWSSRSWWSEAVEWSWKSRERSIWSSQRVHVQITFAMHLFLLDFSNRF